MRVLRVFAGFLIYAVAVLFSCKSDIEPSIKGRWLATSYKVTNCDLTAVNTAETQFPCCTYYSFTSTGWTAESPGYDFFGTYIPPVVVSGTYTTEGNSLRIVYADGSTVLNRTFALTHSTLSLTDDTTLSQILLGGLGNGCLSTTIFTRQ